MRLTVVFHGRENKHKELGQKLLESFQQRLADVAMELLVGNKEVGYFGKLHPLAAEQSGVRSKDLWYFEFSVDDIAKHSGDALKREIKPVSAFPAAWRREPR